MARRYHGASRTGHIAPPPEFPHTCDYYPRKILVRSRKGGKLIAEFYLSEWGKAVFHDHEGCVPEWSCKWDGSHDSMVALASLCGVVCDNPKMHLRFSIVANRDVHATNGVDRHELIQNKAYAHGSHVLTCDVATLIRHK